MRRLLYSLTLLASIGVGTSAQAYGSDPEIIRAIDLIAPLHGNNPALFGYVFEELARAAIGRETGLRCVLSPDPQDPLRDFVCYHPGPGRPLSYQAKAALSATGIAAICDDLRTGRYSGVRMTMPTDTYATVIAKCGAVVMRRGEMVNQSEVASARIQARIGDRPAGVPVGWRFARWIPYVGVLVGAGVTAVETYVAVTDPSVGPSEWLDKGIETASQGFFTWGAAVGASVGACALGAVLVPSSAVVAPMAAGAAAGIGVGYAISATGVGTIVGRTAVSAKRWTVDLAQHGWQWVTNIR